jgi:hypothetical protein
LLRYQDDQLAQAKREDRESAERHDENPELEETRDRKERCRIAIMSSLFAAREVQMDVPQAIAAAE